MTDSAGYNRLKKLGQLGQSPWYDNIDRRLIENGELKKLFDAGVLGVTSNPSIFEKSINSSDVYDSKIKKLAQAGKGLSEIYDELTADDVRDAADLLRDVYEMTKGLDGQVSIEILPALAHDAQRSVEYARRIHKLVDRPNIMIKVPATKESPEIIRALLIDGMNLNITLIFSVFQYEMIATAYIEGLRDRLRMGKDVRSLSSVASVFISRIDTKVDHLLDVFAAREHDFDERKKIEFCKGRIAIANSKLIYQKFKSLFSEKNFGDVKTRGGRPQRVLWASTGTKNPVYSDCLYVDNLIGPMTVNTMPDQTVRAFQDHGKVALTLEGDVEGCQAYIDQVEKLGLSIDKICSEAQNEGVAAFENSFAVLMESLKKKIEI